MTERTLESIGKNAYEAIAGMVAALECDYDRLDELEAVPIYAHITEQGTAMDETALCETCRTDENDGRIDCSGNLELVCTQCYDGQELAELREAAGDCGSREDALQRIQDVPLSIEVRSGWAPIGGQLEAEEFCPLLTTGGPAVRIVGDLDQYGEPSRPRLQVQDWGTPWTEYLDVDRDVLLTYCRQFYFGG